MVNGRNAGDAEHSRYRIGGFELDLSTLELREASGAQVELAPLAFDLLGYLIEHRDRVVPKNELFDALWGDVAVGPSSLSQAVWLVRRALGDTGGAQRVIKNVRGRGYRLVADLEPLGAARTPRVPPPDVSVPPGTPSDGGLIGRRDELARLTSALSAVSAGQGGRVLLLSGWEGMGKTGLAAELARNAEQAGAVVCQAHCYPDETMPSFWPWQQIAQNLLRQHPPDRLAVLMEEFGSELAKLIPELREGIPDVDGAPERMPSQERLNLFDAVRALIEQVAAQKPLLLVIDDLHCADAPTLRCLHFLAPTLASMRVLLLCTMRTPTPGTALEHSVSALVGHRLAEVLALPALSEPDVAALLTARNVSVTEHGLVQGVFDRTSGNPLFVTQLARRLTCHPEAAEQGEDHLQLPGETPAMLRQQLLSLSDPTRNLLQLAAVFGEAFHLGDLRRAHGSHAQEVVRMLEAPLAQRLIRRDAEDVGGFHFAHPTFREVIYEDVPLPTRMGLHRMAAEAIAQAHGGDPTSRCDELAYHYYQAAASGCAAEAVRYCRLAGERACEATAFEVAVTQYRRALHALQLVEPANPCERGKLLLELGSAMRGAAMPVDEVRTVFVDACRCAARCGDVQLLAEAAMGHAGRGPMRVGVLREAGTVHSGEIALLEQALGAVGEADSAQHALVKAWLAYSLYNTERCEERRARACSAVKIARRVGDGLVLAECLMLEQHSVRGPAELHARIAALSEIVELTRAHDMLGLQFDARCELAWAHWEACMSAEAEADMLAMQRVAENSHRRREKRIATYWRAMKLDADGRFEDADTLLTELARDNPSDGRIDQGRAIRQFMIAYLRGRSAELLPSLESIAAKFPLPVAWHCGLVLEYANTGRLSEAQRELDRLALDDFAAIPDDHNWITSHVQLSGTCRLLGDEVRAAMLYKKLLPYADLMCVIGLQGFCGGVTHRALGECASTCGDFAAAERHLLRAIDENTRMGALIWAAASRLDYAGLLLQRGARGDHSVASEQIEAGLVYARSRGLQLLVRRAEALLRASSSTSSTPLLR